MPKGKKRNNKKNQDGEDGDDNNEDLGLTYQNTEDDMTIYRSNLMNPLLNELIVANRLGTLSEAKAAQDQVKFSGLFKLEQFVKDLKSALEQLPSMTLTAYPGDVVAGVQIHQSAGANGVTVQTAPPSAIDLTGSYLHGTALNSNNNVDITITLPQNYFKNDKEFQNYQYFDKKALYISAVAYHLKHYGDLKFSNLFITHEPNDPLKPIIVIQPNQGVNLTEKQKVKNFQLPNCKGMLNKAYVVLHFATPVNAIALRKLAPNRNSVKTLEHQNYVDHTDDAAAHRLTVTSLAESMSIPNIAPTPYYNHQVIQDMLSISASYTYLTVLQQCPALQYIITAAKIWLKLRGMYLENTSAAVNFVKNSASTTALCNVIEDPSIAVEYNQLLQANDEPNVEALQKLYYKTNIYYHYTSQYYNNNHNFGLTGTTLTHIITNLFINGKITTHTNIQQGLDQFFRFLLIHYPDNLNTPPLHTYLPVSYTTLNKTHETNDNMMFSPLILPPDYDQGLTLSTLEQSQQDYSNLYQSSNGEITPGILYHSFDVVQLDHNNIYNIFYSTMSIQAWHQIQLHALYTLKAIYGNNMGSLLSHDVTAGLLVNNYALMLQNSQLTPLTDEEIFQAVYMTRLNDTLKLNTTNGDMTFGDYLQQLHTLYKEQMSLLLKYQQKQGLTDEIQQQSLDQQIAIIGDDDMDSDENIFKKYEILRDEYLLLQQQHPEYNNDTALLKYDHVYDVSLPINYIPYYPIVNAYLYSQRIFHQQTYGKPAASAAKKGTKTTSSSSATGPSVKLDDEYLQNEALIKANMLLPKTLPLYIPNINSEHIKNNTDKNMALYKSFNKFRNKKFAVTTYGESDQQTAEQLQQDGDMTKYIAAPHQPTKPLFLTATTRLTNILLHSLTDRYYALYVEPRCNLSLTSFTWRVYINFNKAEASRGLDKGPFAEQTLKCKEWCNWWGGKKSELRRFPDGSIMETVVWNHSAQSYPLPHDQIVFIIMQHILPLHLFTSNTAPMNNIYYYSNKCTVTTPTHPLGAFLQYKTEQHMIDDYLAEPKTSPLILDIGQPNMYQHNNQSISTLYQTQQIEKLVSPSAPLPTQLLQAYNNLSTMLKEMKTLPLGVDSVQCTSAFMRGTTPFYPKQHAFDFVDGQPNEEMINHFFSSLPNAEAITNPQPQPDEYNNVNTNYVYEPINVILNLGTSNKWPEKDLLAISRVKTAFYLKLGSIIRSEYTDGHIRRTMTFEEAQQRVLEKTGGKAAANKKFKKKGGKDEDIPDEDNTNVGNIYCQVTPYYVDIYINGYVFRCRIVVPHEISVFRAQTSSRHAIPPLALGDGLFRAFEREYVYRPKHHELIKSLANTYPILTTTTQFIYRWLTSHYVTRHFSIELCELLCASVFVNPAPFTAPTTLQSAILRVFYRLANWDFEQRPLIVPNITFVGGAHQATTLKKGTNILTANGQTVDIPLLLQHHKHDVTFDITQYESDIHIDLLPSIYSAFMKRSRDNSKSLIYIVTSYDKESRSWTMRANNAAHYADHLQYIVDKQNQLLNNGTTNQQKQDDLDAQMLTVFNMLSKTDQANKQAVESEMKEKLEYSELQQNILGKHGLLAKGEDVELEDDALVSLQLSQEQIQEQYQQLYKQYYYSLIDRGDDCRYVENSYQLCSAVNYNDLVQIQMLTSAALPAFNALFHFTSAGYSYIPSIYLKQIKQQTKQLNFTKETFPTKTPQQWLFKHYLSLFKPQLSQYDAFIVLHPNVLTVDRLQRSIWLFKTKFKNAIQQDGLTSKKAQKYGEFINFIARASKNPEIYGLIQRYQNDKKKEKASKYKLPPDLARKLQLEEEQKRMEKLNAYGKLDENVKYTLFAGLDFVEQYLDELRGKFGQIASFYSNHQYGSRVICVKFHPFVTAVQKMQEDKESNDEQKVVDYYTLQMIQHRIQKQCANAKNKGGDVIRDINAPDDHVLHPVQAGLHLLGLAPKGKIVGSGNKTKKVTVLVPQYQDYMNQIAHLGRGLVHQVFIGYDDFVENVDF